jgi:hypothetical protein
MMVSVIAGAGLRSVVLDRTGVQRTLVVHVLRAA